MSAGELGLSLAARRHPRLEAVARGLELALDVRVGRVELGCDLELEQRFLVLLGGRVAAAPREVVLRGPQLRPLERPADRDVVGLLAKGLGVLDHGAVEVAQPLGLLGAAERAGRDAPGREQHRQHGQRQPPS